MAFETRNVQKVHEEKEKKMKKEALKKAIIQKTQSVFMLVFMSIWQFIKSHTKGFAYVFGFIVVLIASASYIPSNTESVAKTALSITSSLVGSDLVQTPEGFTNILLIGSGGESHEGGYLTDSIIVVSINHQTKMISMLSLPRDLYLSYSIENRTRKGKLNEVFKTGMAIHKDAQTTGEQFALASEVLKTKVSEIIGSPIAYTVYIDFAGFVKVVDALGGVTVNVEKDISDPLYPGANYSYAPFYLKAGLQNLSGTTALKYVRSRHGNAGGDFGRSARQKQMIVALKEKGFSSGMLTSPSHIQKILDIIKENFWTDLSWKELLGLVNLVADIQKDNIASYNITNTEKVGMGWFLYTPSRDAYNGMSVLIPYGNSFSQIQLYFYILSHFPELSKDPAKMHVMNSTKKEGLGTEVASHLLRYGMKVASTENLAQEYQASTVEYISSPETEKTVAMLQKKFDFAFVPVALSETRKAGEYYFIVGKDYSRAKLLWNPSEKNTEEPVQTSAAYKKTEEEIKTKPTPQIINSPLPMFSPTETEIIKATPKTTSTSESSRTTL